MSLHTTVQDVSGADAVPDPARLVHWAESAYRASGCGRADTELTIRIVAEGEGAELNRDYRGAKSATNVLAFAYEASDAAVDADILGDVVVCAPVVAGEALEQDKESEAHWAHMVVHGVLHLCGYDHVAERDAQAMERLETEIMSSLGFRGPYRDDER